MKFLIVDDFPTMRRIICSLLREIGYGELTEAEDGEVAMACLKSRHFDFVVTDWNMPKMNGLELLREIRSDPQLRTMPILMVTAESKKENIIAAARAGANGYIVKPFTSSILKDKVEQILKKQHGLNDS